MNETRFEKAPFNEIQKLLLFRLDKFPLKTTPGEIVLRISIQTGPSDPLRWLSVQKNEMKVFFSPRGTSRSLAGAGCIFRVGLGNGGERATLSRAMAGAGAGEIRCYGGIAFPDGLNKDRMWNGFGGSTFIIPRFEFSSDKTNGTFTVNFLNSENNRNGRRKIMSEINGLVFSDFFFKNESYLCSLRRHIPEKSLWKKRIDDYLKMIETGMIDKVVAARKTELDITGDLDPFRVLDSLRKEGDHSAHFLFCFDGKNYFLGATPEVLFRRNKNVIHTESLAGTAPRGSSTGEDDILGRSLMESEKEVREHHMVTDHIVNRLKMICSRVETEEKGLRKLSTLQHIHRRIRGRLKINISDLDVLGALFPTPAVSGHPVQKSIHLLRKTEEFSRGWYAGVIGVMGNAHSEFYAGIRSALMNEKKIWLYSGAGIVEGSDPEKEWDEIELKIRKYKMILNYEH